MLSGGRIVSELTVATAWQPIQAPAGAVPRDVARGHSPADLGQLLWLGETVGSRTQRYTPGRVTSSTNALGTFGYAYQGLTDRLLSISRSGGLTTGLSYVTQNGEVRLNQLTNTAGGTTVSRFSYGYDLDGLITSLGRELSGQPTSTSGYDYLVKDAAIQKMKAGQAAGKDDIVLTEDIAKSPYKREIALASGKYWFIIMNNGKTTTDITMKWYEPTP